MLPKIIQGGQGVFVSNYTLARLVSVGGGLGTVSAVAAQYILARMLQKGDPDGDFRRALATFPNQQIVEEILFKYFVPDGKPEDKSYITIKPFSFAPQDDLIALSIAGAYCLVWLSKEGHTNPVSINILEKMQLPIIYYLYGAMLANVDVVSIGAGLPMQIPSVLDDIADGKNPSYDVNVAGDSKSKFRTVTFDVHSLFGERRQLKRPSFLPIVSSKLAADVLLRDRLRKKGSYVGIDGFVVENHIAGGHNAPPRDKKNRIPNAQGELVYGPADQIDFIEFSKQCSDNKIPFWLAGGYSSFGALKEAESHGAHGIQAGSIFALSHDSGMLPRIRRTIRRLAYRDELRVRTDAKASPTGFPFKMVDLEGTMSDPNVYERRSRLCDKGCLSTPYIKDNGEIGFRCSAEPVHDFVRKGGRADETENAICLCNGLTATVGLGNPGEPPVLTLGEDLGFLRDLMKHEDDSYSALDALDYLRGIKQNIY